MSQVAAARPGTDGLVERARQHALGDLPRRTALRRPDKMALVDGETRLTFAELDATINRMANALGARGLAKGDRLALLSHNCWQFAALAFATARLGVVLVPVNFMLGAEEVTYILDHSGAGALVAEDSLAGVAAEAAARVPTVALRGWIPLGGAAAPDGWEDVGDWVAHPDASLPDVAIADDDPLRIMYTSGTESRPKGVLHSSRSLLWQYASCVMEGGMVADDVDLHALPLYHCAQLDCLLGPDIYLGASGVIVRGPDPSVVLATIERERVTKFFAPPTVWISLLRSPQFDATDLSSLRSAYYGASAMPVEVLKELRERLPRMRLWNFYGQTEMAPLATILGPEEQSAAPGSAGRPAVNCETRVVDDEDRPLPVGEVGEIVHRSPHATAGYYRDEEKTAEAFRAGWFHSGDLGRFDAEGRLYVVDRKKDMIKTGGENVASREVEEVVYRLDGVAEVAVFGIDHPRWVEAVTAVVVPKPGVTITPDGVIAHCRTHLAGYKTPKYVVVADSLPKNPSGKVLKRELRQHYGDGSLLTTDDPGAAAPAL